MRSMIPDYLSEAIADVAPDTSGAPAQYIPELAAADPIRVLELQGEISFAGAERVVREAVKAVPAESGMALDLTRVHSVADVARRMLLEITRRLALDGHEVVVDSESVLPDAGDGARVTVAASLDTLARTGRR